MGTPATATIEIYVEDCPANQDAWERLKQDFLTLRANQTNSEYLILNFSEEFDGDFGIYDIEVLKDYVQIKLESGRIQNAEWQIDRIADLVKRANLSTFEFDATIQTSEGYRWFDQDGE